MFLPNIPVIECIIIRIVWCISCTCAVPVALICSQLFGVKTYNCVSLFYVCYCTSLITIPPTTQYINISAIWSSQQSICKVVTSQHCCQWCFLWSGLLSNAWCRLLELPIINRKTFHINRHKLLIMFMYNRSGNILLPVIDTSPGWTNYLSLKTVKTY